MAHSYLNLAGFRPARMDHTDLSDSCAHYTNFGLVTKPQQVISDMREADLNRVDAYRAAFVYVDLSGATFIQANLTDVTLHDVSLRGANLTGAVVDGATFFHVDLRGADLSGVQGLTAADLRASLTDATTRLPANSLTTVTHSPGARTRPACAGPFGYETPIPSFAAGR
jgi:uncharacterized protein YjbI with pentapeptide repeats